MRIVLLLLVAAAPAYADARLVLGPQPSITASSPSPPPLLSLATSALLPPLPSPSLPRLAPLGVDVAGALLSGIAMGLGMQIGRLTDPPPICASFTVRFP